MQLASSIQETWNNLFKDLHNDEKKKTSDLSQRGEEQDQKQNESALRLAM